MELTKETNFRMIEQEKLAIPCYFYGYFKSPGLESYPELPWINDDYNLIKTKDLDEQHCAEIANNLFLLGKKFDLFQNLDYFVMMPLKSTSISSLEKVILKLIALIESNLAVKIKLVSDLFIVQDYRKFWENRLNLADRKKEIDHKISLKPNYQHLFDDKNIIIIDDVVSTGTSIAQVILQLQSANKNVSFKALTYGSVYQWEKIYS